MATEVPFVAVVFLRVTPSSVRVQQFGTHLRVELFTSLYDEAHLSTLNYGGNFISLATFLYTSSEMDCALTKIYQKKKERNQGRGDGVGDISNYST